MATKNWISLVLVLGLNACGAHDLGDQDPQSIAVNSSGPTWNNGIGDLVKAKCANCHASSRNKFVPSNVPSVDRYTINDIGFESFFDGSTPKKKGLAYTVAFKIAHDGAYPMPSRFATPLNVDERKGLELWLSGKGFSKDAICPTSESELTYADVEPTIKEKCAYAGCHGPTNLVLYQLDTFEKVKLYRSKSLGYMASAYMPFGSESGFLNSEKGSKLRDWLCGGKEFR